MNSKTDQHPLCSQHLEWSEGGWEFCFGHIKCEMTNRHPRGSVEYMKNLKSHPFSTQLSPELESYSLNHERSRHFHISPWMRSSQQTQCIWNKTHFPPQHVDFLFVIPVSAVDCIIFQVTKLLNLTGSLGSSLSLSNQINHKVPSIIAL